MRFDIVVAHERFFMNSFHNTFASVLYFLRKSTWPFLSFLRNHEICPEGDPYFIHFIRVICCYSFLSLPLHEDGIPVILISLDFDQYLSSSTLQRKTIEGVSCLRYRRLLSYDWIVNRPAPLGWASTTGPTSKSGLQASQSQDSRATDNFHISTIRPLLFLFHSPANVPIGLYLSQCLSADTYLFMYPCSAIPPGWMVCVP